MGRSRVWRVILIMVVILLMSFSLLFSVNNSSDIGNSIKKSDILVKVEKKYNKIMQEALGIKIAPVP